MDGAVKSRYAAFFEGRLEVGDPSELARFDTWLGANCLSAAWRLYAYSRALDICRYSIVIPSGNPGHRYRN